MRERIKELGYWVEDKLREWCGEITPDKRLTVIILVLFLFVVANLYLTFSTVYHWENEYRNRQQMKIEHIKQPNINQPDSDHLNENDNEQYE